MPIPASPVTSSTSDACLFTVAATIRLDQRMLGIAADNDNGSLAGGRADSGGMSGAGEAGSTERARVGDRLQSLVGLFQLV